MSTTAQISFRSVVSWAAVTAAIAAGVFLLVRSERTVTAERTQQTTATLLALRSTDHVLGTAENPAITIIEYSDFQCPACAASRTVTDNIEKAFPGKVAFAYRHFPLTGIHPHAEAAAIAAEAAAQQGKFWEMHDLLFDKQDEWAAERDPSASFASYAATLGLDTARFAADLKSDAVQERVAADAADADVLRLEGTPTVFVNGAQVRLPRTAEAFVAQMRALMPAAQ